MRRDPHSSGFQESVKTSADADNDPRKLKKRVKELESEISRLKERLDQLSVSHQTSVELSVDFLYDLEYHRYKSSFIDIDISLHPGNPKTLPQYGQNIKRFFMENLGCSYLYIFCGGISRIGLDSYKLKQARKAPPSPETVADRTRVYYVNLQDMDLPERTIGKLVLGRSPYKDQKKETVFDLKIRAEIELTKKLLENVVSVIQNKELAVKDALTGLSTRKVFEERLYDEFISLDHFSKLNEEENSLLQAIINADAQPRRHIKGLFFKDRNTSDEVLFDKIMNKFLERGIVTKSQERHMGTLEEFYTFKSSKLKQNLFVAMFDLDHFKDVNDNWGGHDVGDTVLKRFAEILKKNIRTTDTPIRYGGEEFIVLFTRVESVDKIVLSLDRIRRECERSLIVEHAGKRRNVTVSIGLTRISKFDRNIEQIVRRVDAALYRAKQQRNRIVFYEQERNEYKRII